MKNIISFLPYITIVACSSFFAFRSQVYCESTEERNTEWKYRKSLYILSFLIAWFFIGFTKVGVDYNNYLQITNVLKWNNFYSYSYLEIGFNLVLLIIKTIFKSPHIVLFFVKTFTIILVYAGIWAIKDEVRIGYAVSAYLLLFYVPSFYLLSICFAASIVFCTLIFWRKRHNLFFTILLLILAANMHNSCFLIIPVFIACICIERTKRTSSLIKALIVFVYVFIVFASSFLFSMAEKYLSFFHYSKYNMTNSGGTGLMVFVVFLPLIYISYVAIKNSNEKENNVFLFVFSITIFLFRVLSYRFIVIERMEFILMPMYIMFLPIAIHSKPKYRVYCAPRIPKFTFFVIIYILFRAYLVFSEYITVETELVNYMLFNPFN